MYSELLDPLFLLSAPNITKGLGAIIVENLDPESHLSLNRSKRNKKNMERSNINNKNYDNNDNYYDDNDNNNNCYYDNYYNKNNNNNNHYDNYNDNDRNNGSFNKNKNKERKISYEKNNFSSDVIDFGMTSTLTSRGSSYSEHGQSDTPNLEERDKNNYEKRKKQKKKKEHKKIVETKSKQGQDTRKQGEQQHDEDEDEDERDGLIMINFTQFFHLLLQIAEVIYPEIYNDRRCPTQYVTSSTDNASPFQSGPTRALEKIIRVSTCVLPQN